MTNAQKTHGAVYVTQDKNGTPRFNSYARGRLWPMSRKVAEASFAAGATVFQKESGVSIWVENPKVVVG